MSPVSLRHSDELRKETLQPVLSPLDVQDARTFFGLSLDGFSVQETILEGFDAGIQLRNILNIQLSKNVEFWLPEISHFQIFKISNSQNTEFLTTQNCEFLVDKSDISTP